MQHALIINIRDRLRWHQRLACDASTFALWSMWLWLCRPVVLSLLGLVGISLGASQSPAHPLFPGAGVTLEDAVIWLLSACGVLMAWNRLASQPAVRPRLDVHPDFAAHFRLDAAQIAQARSSAISTVHHDEHGRITRIESLRS